MTEFLTIENIHAASDLPLVNSAGRVHRPGDPSDAEFQYEVWSKDQSMDDWGNGSTQPVALQISEGKVLSTFKTNLKIEAKCLFPSTYPREPPPGSLCQLIGTMSKHGVTFTSETFRIQLKPPPPNPPPSEIKDINVSNIEVTLPMKDLTCLIPFRLAGDVDWVVHHVESTPVAPDLPSLKPTRLELCYLFNKAPSLRDWVNSSAGKTGVDMQGKWPISLLRMFLPSPDDLKKPPQSTEKVNAWWADQIVKRLLPVPCTMDTIAGKSGFGVCCSGGSFDLGSFVKEVLAPDGKVAKRPLINSFDLTALLQLGSALLLDAGGYEKLDSLWTPMTPYGFFKPCMPFGVDNKKVTWPPGLNNPYFMGQNPPISSDPFVEEKKLDNSAYSCAIHSWLEVNFTNKESRKVLDVSFPAPLKAGGQPVVDNGVRERTEFVVDHVVDPGSYKDCRDGDTKGGCWPNNDFSTTQTGRKDTTAVARVGVYNTYGINRPRTGPIIAPFTPIPTILRPDIDKAIQSGKSTPFPAFGFNDASLKQMNVVPVLLDTHGTHPVTVLVPDIPKGGKDETDILVGRAVTKVMYRFTGMPVSPTEVDGSLAINVLVFDRYEDAYEAMAFELAKYERGMAHTVSVLSRGKTPVHTGHYSLRTPHSVLCMHGNLFVEMTIVSTSRPDTAALELLTSMMERLDKYIGDHTVQYDQVRRPSLATVSAVPKEVTQKTTFQVEMKDIDTLAETTQALVSDGQLILGLDSEFGRFSYDFVVDSIGADKFRDVELTIAAAEMDTFHPGYQVYEVRVLKG